MLRNLLLCCSFLHKRSSKDYSFFIIVNPILSVEMDVLFIESIYLIAASGKLFHGPQEVRKAWMFFFLGCKVCCGEG